MFRVFLLIIIIITVIKHFNLNELKNNKTHYLIHYKKLSLKNVKGIFFNFSFLSVWLNRVDNAELELYV